MKKEFPYSDEKYCKIYRRNLILPVFSSATALIWYITSLILQTRIQWLDIFAAAILAVAIGVYIQQILVRRLVRRTRLYLNDDGTLIYIFREFIYHITRINSASPTKDHILIRGEITLTTRGVVQETQTHYLKIPRCYNGLESLANR